MKNERHRLVLHFFDTYGIEEEELEHLSLKELRAILNRLSAIAKELIREGD